MARAMRTIGMALADPLQWVIIGVIIVALLAVVAYVLLRIIQTLARQTNTSPKRKKPTDAQRAV